MHDPDQTDDPSPDVPRPTFVDPPLDEHPKQIGRYRVEKVLGEGGFGLVYLAHDDQLRRAVAIKVPRPGHLARPADAEAYLAEARTVAGLDHPNIVPIFDVGTTPDGLCFVVSKVIDGSDLARKIRQGRPPHTQSAELIATVAEALHYAHCKGLVHRDIKPANILLDAGGKPYVADFGLALTEEDFGRVAGYAGTPAYMSPEQARGEGHRVDGRSDVFSLGVVFYELLVGRRPFRADSQHELLDQITTVEARPPRQVDDKVPKELERICLKALSKRASERYTTAKDMADDLRHFLGSGSVGERSTTSFEPVGECAVPTPVPTSVPAPASDQRPLKIVPKGLRSFDANDADFFLELLPGPRDRDGLPDGIRFWKTRMEATDPDDTFSVGLIYGPSGCGKSSLVKAGLLPRLAKRVVAVYVEATADETEARLLKGLRKACPGLPESLGVIETLAALRRGKYLPAGKKVVIVLDQFEQWLHAKKEERNTELVRASRHCDGGRVQCVVMVRDDFWMAATRFMRELEVRLLEGQNSAAVDLFDSEHARKVLAAFGRAFGKLPETNGNTSKDQKQFLEQAVSGLAQESKVISVRLALFAEMMKGKPWTPTTLKEVGGAEGVGVTFLEETFSAAHAPPEHRYHQRAARGVLKALLPESGTDIKGHMRSHADLLEASGYGNRPKDFDDLLRILDGEIRLITPTDPEGKEGDGGATPEAEPGRKYYQLTHDYLVPSLREWLTRKQKETRRGRAELLLADRSVAWNARPEARQLPSLLQWSQIEWFLSKKGRTPPQQKMMRQAARYHAIRGAAVAVVLAVAGFTGLTIRDQVEERRKATHAAGLVRSLLDSEIAQVPVIVNEMKEYRRWTDPILKEENGKAADRSRQKLHTSLALLAVDPDQVDYLYGRLLDAEPHSVPVIRDALLPHKDALIDKLWAVVETPEKGKESQRLRAAAGLAEYDPDGRAWATAERAVGDDLVAVPAVYSSSWMDSFRPVRVKLLPQIANVFRDPDRRETERALATEILADYAADQPALLADLLMDADENQFTRIYPLVEKQKARSLPKLSAEIEKRVIIAQDKPVFETRGVVAAGDPTVQPSQGVAMPAKKYEVRLQGGKTYRLTMTSKGISSALLLQDESAKELALDGYRGGNLNSMLVYRPEEDGTYTAVAASAKGFGPFRLKIAETFGGDDGKERLAKRQANAGVALLRLGQAEKVWPLLKRVRGPDDPRTRSYLIHRLRTLGADDEVLARHLEREQDVTIRRALISSLGEPGRKEVSLDLRNALVPTLQAIFRTDADPGLHASAEWLLRTWKHESWLKKTNEEWAGDKEDSQERLDAIKRSIAKEKDKTPPQWLVNGQGQTMVVIPGPVTFMMGSPPIETSRAPSEWQYEKRIGRSFAFAAKSVTVEQYRQFAKGYQLPAMYTRLPGLPVIGIDWYQAARYCNWLSEREGIPKDQWCYEIDGEKIKSRAKYLSLSGYRLPTEAEIEYATRAGAVTAWYYGDTEELLPKYGWYQKNSQDKTWPVGSLKPNDLGLFDMHGNTYSWCQEEYHVSPRGEDVGDDKEGDLTVPSDAERGLRGGSFHYQASVSRSAARYSGAPSERGSSIGFRVARTIVP